MDIAKEIRGTLKEEYPDYKFAVSIQRYSGGQSMNINLMSGSVSPFSGTTSLEIRPNNGRWDIWDTKKNDVVTRYSDKAQAENFIDEQKGGRGYADVNHYYIDSDDRLTPKAKEMFKNVKKIVNKRNWDKSDIQTDYFDVNFYYDINIGKYNKPFKLITPAPKATEGYFEKKELGRVKNIIVTRAEGPIEMTGKPQTFKTFADANKWLRESSMSAPKGGGYDKHDFKVEWNDGTIYEGRLDVKHWSNSDNDTDIAQHIKNMASYAVKQESFEPIAKKFYAEFKNKIDNGELQID